MNFSEITFNVTSLVTIVGAVMSVLSVYVKLNNKIAIINKEQEVIKDDVTSNHRELIIIVDKREKQVNKEVEIIHERIDRVKEDVRDNRIKSEKETSDLKSAMQEMELRIIKAIHEIKK